MEQLNRIELRGTVGSIKVQTYSGKKVGRINLATSMAFKDKSGTPVIETQWHSVNAWEGKTIEDVDSIGKGDKLYVVGRVKYSKFTGTDGVDHYNTEIQALKLVRIDDEDELQIPCS